MATGNNAYFCGRNGPYGFCSNWTICVFVEKMDKKEVDYCPVELDGKEIKYSSTEQHMMAHKALVFGDGETYNEIMKENDPKKIKELGRKIKGFDNDKWNQYRKKIVTNGNRLKFGQNPDLMKRLLETGDMKLVEAADYDKIWGIGLNEEDARKTPEDKWPGKNKLGKILMKIRDENKKN